VNVQFDWQAGTDDGQWEIVAQSERQPLFGRLRRVPRWAWVVVVVVSITTIACGYVLLRRQYEVVSEEIGFHVQDVIDLEARAYALGDRELFLEQQDRAAIDWYEYQVARIDGTCECDPVLPAEVQDIELRGDVVWVEVLEGEPRVRRARFYRQTELGWKQTAPRVEFFQLPVQLRYGALTFWYHRRDEPYVDPLIERIHETVGQVCATVDCPGLSELQVVFSVDVRPDQPPELRDNVLTLPSPWLSGIPADGAWTEEHLRQLTYRVSSELTTSAARTAEAPSPALIP